MAPRTDPRFPILGRLAWRSAWPLARLAAAAGFRLEVLGGPPPSGPLVVAANHFSHLDPPLVGVAVRRPVRFLTLDELFGYSAAFNRLILGLGAIPINRLRPTHGPMRLALAHLALGGAVGLFPEGRRVAAWGSIEPRAGAAWLAVRSGAPLLPVAIWGTQAAWPICTRRPRPARVRIILGEPLWPQHFRRSPLPIQAMMQAWAGQLTRNLEFLAG